MNASARSMRHSINTLVGAATLAVAASALSMTAAFARQPAAPQAPDATMAIVDLEKVYWLCDYARTHSSVDSETGAYCNARMRELAARKFDGDAARLAAWRDRELPAQHSAMQAARGAR